MINCFHDDDAFYSLAAVVRKERLDEENRLENRMPQIFRVFKLWCRVFGKKVTVESMKEHLIEQHINLNYAEKKFILAKYFRKTKINKAITDNKIYRGRANKIFKFEEGTPCNTK